MQGNIYQAARKMAGITQEKAAEALNIHVNTLSGWENGQGEPDKLMIGNMITVYNTPQLAMQYVFFSPLMEYVPKCEVKDLPLAFVNFLNHYKQLGKVIDEALNIISDGVIDKHEEEVWQEIEELLKKLSDSGYEVIFAKK